MTRRRWSVAIVLSATILFCFGCKKSQEQLEAEESRKIIESKSALHERLKKNRADRAEREKYLKAHPELLEPPAEPDPAHRPTAPAPSNLPPQLFGAPAVDPAVALSAFPPSVSASPSSTAKPRP
jgi:hypothetical protein